MIKQQRSTTFTIALLVLLLCMVILFTTSPSSNSLFVTCNTNNINNQNKNEQTTTTTTTATTATAATATLPIVGATVKARVIVPRSEIMHGVRVMLNQKETFYVNRDGSFELTNLSPGIHLIDVISTHFIYPQIRIDVSSKANNKARAFRLVPRVTNPMTSEDLTYVREPLNISPSIQIVPLAEAQYFERREPFSVLPLLKNPMVIMLIVGVGMAYLFPKIVDPEAMKEAQATLSSSESEFKNLLGGLQQQQPTQQQQQAQQKKNQ